MRVFSKLAVLGVAAALAQATYASPVVTTWHYNVSTVFDTSTTLFSAGGGSTTNTPTLLQWGVVDAGHPLQSGLEITGNPAIDKAFAGPINTTISPALPSYPDSEIGLTQTFIHHNNILPSSSKTLLSVDAIGTLTLDPSVPDNPALPTFPPLTFHINFAETPNNASPCADPATSNPCPDIFVIGGGLNNFTFWYNTTSGALSPVDPGDPEFNRYFVQIFPFPPNSSTPLQTLSDAVKTAC